MKQGLKLKQDLRNRRGIRVVESLSQATLVESLVTRVEAGQKLHFLGLEYRFVADFLESRIRNRNDLFQKLRGAIVKFAKRQETWFRRMEKRGIEIHWIDGGDMDAAGRIVRKWEALDAASS